MPSGLVIVSRKARPCLPLALLVCVSTLGGCTTFRPPQISYDNELPPAPDFPALADDRPRPLHVPPAWKAARGGNSAEPKEPVERIETANDAARVQPRKAGYYNAVQVFSYSPGALYQIYAAPGQITDIALEPGEQLIGSGPVAAGDTVRWVVGDTESGSGDTRRVHIMVKPTRPSIETNLVVNTDRRTYLIELRAQRKALYALGRLVLSGGSWRANASSTAGTLYSGPAGAPVPLRDRGRQPAVASRQRL
ncbi:hypothetical protein ACVWZV_000059 [Bradyrhizobium sp. GM5.1]